MSGFAGVSAIALDGDGTLWDFESSMRAALERSAAALNAAGLLFAGKPIDPLWLAQVREEVAPRPELAGAKMEAIRLAAFEEAIRRCDPARVELAAEILERYLADRLTVLEAYPDSAAALTGLAGRFRLALVTNGNTHPDRVGLGAGFAAVLFASECGHMKPDPRLYALAAKRLGVEPDACVHVGDHPLEDVDAARRAGMRTVWLNRDGRAWPQDLEAPQAEIADLGALASLLSAE